MVSRQNEPVTTTRRRRRYSCCRQHAIYFGMQLSIYIYYGFIKLKINMELTSINTTKIVPFSKPSLVSSSI